MQPPYEYLGPYRIGQPLGRGGMGTVYRGTHAKTGQQVAVKLIANTVADDSRFRRRFADEIETLKRLKHPHIVRLIGYGEQSGQLFYSMELVEGESLQQRLKREHRLAWPTVVDFAIDVCAALKHAHDFGVIHRDLKPANLLVDSAGTVKLVDFGIAKLFGTSDQTAAGSVLGTADYMAPEQAGHGPISPRTDLYALGNVLYACLAGRPPFAGRSFTQVIEALHRDAVPPLNLYAAGVPNEIIELVHDLLAKRPEDRPPTALAVSNRLKAIRAGLARQQTSAADGGTVPSSGLAARETRPGSAPGDRPTTAAEADPFTLGGFDETTSQRPTLAAERPEERSPSPTRPVPNDPAAEGLGAGHSAANTPKPDDPKPSAAGARRPAKPAAAGTVAAEPTGDQAAATPTHYRTVDDKERGETFLSSTLRPPVETNWWAQGLSIAAMLTVLAAGGYLFWRAMQQPTASELYAALEQAQADDDSAAYRAAAERFLKLYPDDPRGQGLEAVIDQRSIQQIVRRLQAAALRQGGVDRLAIDEQAFLVAVADRDINPQATRQRLQGWLDLFWPDAQGANTNANAAGTSSGKQAANDLATDIASNDAPNNATADSEATDNATTGQTMTARGMTTRVMTTRAMMARAAQRELEQMPLSLPAGDRRLEELREQIRWGQQQLTADEQRKQLEAILVLFADQPWAGPLIDELRQQLQAPAAEGAQR